MKSAGTWAISVEEVSKSEARALDDEFAESAPPAPVPPGHGVVDVRPYNDKMRRRIGGKLAIAAHNRGRQHPAG